MNITDRIQTDNYEEGEEKGELWLTKNHFTFLIILFCQYLPSTEMIQSLLYLIISDRYILSL